MSLLRPGCFIFQLSFGKITLGHCHLCHCYFSHLAWNVRELDALGVTYILNAAHGDRPHQVNTQGEAYINAGMRFMGIPALDEEGYDLGVHFQDAADFIKESLGDEGEKGRRGRLGKGYTPTQWPVIVLSLIDHAFFL